MAQRTYDLASLLDPISLDEFLAAYWGKNFLWVQRQDEGYYERLITNQNLEDLLSSPDARYPSIMLAKNGVYYPAQVYCEDVKMGYVTFSGVPNLKKLSAEYGKGATIALTSLDRSWKPLGELCLQLEEQLDHGINTNVYITAGQTTGFPPHYDTHDILFLQVAGRKRWRIYEPSIKLPDVSQPCEPKSFKPGPQIAQIELQAGDLLYLPRGYGHAATTSQSHSAHVTVGIHVRTWAGILKELDPSCIRLEECRQALPPGFASRVELRPAMKERLRHLLPGHFADRDLDRLLDSFIRNVNHSRRRPPGRFRTEAIVISMSSLLRTLPEHRYRISRLIDQPGKPAALTLDFDGNTYSFPEQLDAVLQAMGSRASFRLQDLPGSDFNSEALLELAGYLQSIGFLSSSLKP